MRTSVFCLRDQRGFTLLELLVVMAVVGLLAGLVAPSLQRMAGSIDRATKREGLMADIAGLSYRAYALGQSFELSEQGVQRILSDGNPVLALPAGWRVQMDHPIQFAFNGLCSGGRLTLVSPDRVVEALQLHKPDCRLSHDG